MVFCGTGPVATIRTKMKHAPAREFAVCLLETGQDAGPKQPKAAKQQAASEVCNDKWRAPQKAQSPASGY